MIGRLRGELVEREPTRAVVVCHGIGFEVGIPLSTSQAMPAVGHEVDLYIDSYFSRDRVQLFGFATAEERAMFRLLTSVKGIGPRAGLNLLSRFSPAEIASAVADGRVDVIQTVPSIGPQKAATIIKKLQQAAPAVPAIEPILADAEAALVSLGLSRREAQQRLVRVKRIPGMGLQELLKQALRVD